MTTAIECKDKGRAIGVPDIEAFVTKCQRNDIGRMVMVTSGTFTSTAPAKAKAAGVTLMTLREAESFPWVGISVFVKAHRDYDPVTVMFAFDERQPVRPFKVFHENGEEIPLQAFLSTAEQSMPMPTPLPEEPQRAYIEFDQPLTVVDANGETFVPAKAYVELTYRWVATPQPFELHTYTGDGVQYEIASSQLDVGAAKGRIVMRKGEDGSIGVMWMPELAPTTEKPKRARRRRPKE